MKKYAKKLFGSRRVGLTLMGLLVLCAGKYLGWDFSSEELASLAGITGSGVLSLGMGHWGNDKPTETADDE